MGGWVGKILRVDLTAGDYLVEDVDTDLARNFIGGRGLGSKLLYDEIDPEVDPFDAENKLIFMTGPLTGTGVPCGARYMVITKSPLSGTIASSNSGGYFGPELKFAGYDGIIFEGCAPEPVYVWINDDEVEIRSASHLWGKTTHETEDLIRAEAQNSYIAQEMHVASIGPAGEKLSRIASIMNDKHRAAGRSGVGAVMGSKNLKAVAVRGTRKIGLADKEAFQNADRHARDLIRAGEVTSQALPAFGTAAFINIINQAKLFPTKNWQENYFEMADRISGETMAATVLKRRRGCFACPIGCGRVTDISDSPYAGMKSAKNKGEGPEYETMTLMGASCGIDDIAAITKANYLCNELGMDTISAGSTIACAMELYEKGYIPEEDMGLKANFGNAEALVVLMEKMGKREGIGDSMAEGAYRLAEKYGHPECFMGVKKLEAPGYDPRGAQGIGLTYATGNRGACHVRGYTIADEIAGVHEQVDPLITEGKPAMVKTLQDITALIDSSGLCLFVALAPNFLYEEIQSLLNAASGAKYSLEELIRSGERIWNLERLFNLKAGFTNADDTLPRRILEEPGGPRGDVCRLDEMLPEYYRLRGWDEHGVPTSEKLQELGLQ